MKSILTLSVALVFAIAPAYAQRKATIENVPDIHYTSVPNFLIALLIVLIFGVQLGILPIASMRGSYTPGTPIGFNATFILDVLFHAALPISVFFLTNLGHWILSMRSATLAALDEDYVTALSAFSPRGMDPGADRPRPATSVPSRRRGRAKPVPSRPSA